MFYEIKAKSHVRVPPTLLEQETEEAVLTRLNEQFEGHISNDVGFIICVTEVLNIGEGIIIPGDGAAFYETEFKFLTYIPEIQELVLGKITDITNFGAFINIGPVDGMIHVSQTMDDFIGFSKQKTLTGKESKKVLKVGDKCRARIIAVSYKDIANPKIGLTMRQPALGSLKWIEEEQKKAASKKGKGEK
ncbi:MAG TPA: DNA-directed RNA polymerase [Candidatus Nanoarchaeia archaeon]|nr:DNA-directed RNA polymerase [Candidatus Nanoarchaeia archaeon]